MGLFRVTIIIGDGFIETYHRVSASKQIHELFIIQYFNNFILKYLHTHNILYNIVITYSLGVVAGN